MKKDINRKRKLIALVTNHDDDVYCFRKELIEGLINAGYNVLISCPHGEKLELMGEIKFYYDDVFIDRRGTNPVSDLKLLVHYRRLFSKRRPDVVLTYTSKPNVYAGFAAYSLGIPYISNVTGLGSVLGMNRIMQKFVLNLFRMSFRHSSCIMFQNSENMLLAKENGLVYGDCLLIPGSGVNTERFPLQEYPDGGDGLTGAKVVFNYIGRVLHDKGIDDYIEAAKRIKKKFPNTEFNVIGFIEPTEGKYEEELKELQEKEILFYRGQQKDVKPFIAKSHATIHPSTYGEGMSNVLLESASSGRALITTDNAGCRETVNDGETGFIYQGGNVDALVEKIELFLSLDNKCRELMGLKGRDRMKEYFSRQVVVDAYLEKLKNLVL